MDRFLELIRLHRQGISDKKASILLKMGPNTLSQAKKILRREHLWDGAPEALPDRATLLALFPQRTPPQQISSAAPWAEAIRTYLLKGVPIAALHARLTLDFPDFRVSYDAVKRLARRLIVRPPSADQVVIPVETSPAQVAQVDFAYIGLVHDGQTPQPKKAWVFVMTLAFSRHFFAWVVFDQRVATWLDLHVRAFAFFGGVPKTVVPDNLKAAVISTSFGLDPDLEAQRSYRELARHYGFLIDPTPPYSPQKKGKVERNVAYVEGFLKARNPDWTVDTLNQDLLRWNQTIAATRLHGTTGISPRQRFDEEKPFLLPLPVTPYDPAIWRCVRVQPDAHVYFEQRFYSVPWAWMGQEIWLRATTHRVVLYGNEQVLADHARIGSTLYSTRPGHLPKRADLAERDPQIWQEKAARLGPSVAAWVAEQLAGQAGVSRLSRIQAVILLLEEVPAERAEAIGQRALQYGLCRVKEFKRVLEQGLDRQASPATEPVVEASGKFCRPLHELTRCHQENRHEGA